MSTRSRIWPNTLDATDPLLEAGRIPGQVDVDQGAESLKVQPLARCVGGHHEPDCPVADRPLDILALDTPPLAGEEYPRLARAGVKAIRSSFSRSVKLRATQ